MKATPRLYEPSTRDGVRVWGRANVGRLQISSKVWQVWNRNTIGRRYQRCCHVLACLAIKRL